ncbi:MAG: cytochrome c [Alphaproteobacteria bacterium]|nr:cytochrome c [Alphaproteobacteria bacterium]
MPKPNMPKPKLIAAALLILALPAAGTARAEDVETLFKFYCAQCHGLDGKGGGPNVSKDFPVTPRDFTIAAEMNKLTDADVRNVIADGGPAASKSPLMPPWGKTLSEAEIGELTKHLRKLCNCKGKQG